MNEREKLGCFIGALKKNWLTDERFYYLRNNNNATTPQLQFEALRKEAVAEAETMYAALQTCEPMEWNTFRIKVRLNFVHVKLISFNPCLQSHHKSAACNICSM